MFCTKCGAKIIEGNLFCVNCGAKVASPKAAPVTSVPSSEVLPKAASVTPVLNNAAPVSNVEKPSKAKKEKPVKEKKVKEKKVKPVKEKKVKPVKEKKVKPVKDKNIKANNINQMVEPGTGINGSEALKPAKKPRKKKKGLIITFIIIIILAVAGGVAYWQFGDEITSFFTGKDKSDSKKDKDADDEDSDDDDDDADDDDDDDDGKDKKAKATRTIMLYIVGSDLESNGGYATKQIKEILDADPCDEINIVLQTGGCTNWKTRSLTDKEVERSVIEDGELTVIENLGKVQMSKSSTLSEFIEWAADNYPAEDYSIIFYNHGGSASGGFGVDELYKNKAMRLDEMEEAFSDAGVHFEFIGFDACEMSNIETAYIFKEHADYLVASESVEYSYSGWNYTGWLNDLAKDPTMSTKSLCIDIADYTEEEYLDFIDNVFDKGTYTIAVTDLSEMEDLYEKFCEFCADLRGCIESGTSMGNVVNIRYHSQHFGSKDTDLIDISDFATRCKIDTTKALVKAVGNAVIYNKTNSTNSSGLGMYMPYYFLDNYQATMDSITPYMNDEDYVACLNEFASVIAFCNDWGDEYDWYDDEIGEISMEYVPELAPDGKNPFVLDENNVYTWDITDVWVQLATLTSEIYIQFGTEYLKLGVYDYSYGSGTELKVTCPTYYYSIDGNMIPLYYQERDKNIEGDDFTYYYSPAILERDGYEYEVNLVTYFDYGATSGEIIGFVLRGEDFSTITTSANQFEDGDVITVIFEYFDSNLELVEEVESDNIIEYDGSKIEVTQSTINQDLTIYYRSIVMDYYQRYYFSPFAKNGK